MKPLVFAVLVAVCNLVGAQQPSILSSGTDAPTESKFENVFRNELPPVFESRLVEFNLAGIVAPAGMAREFPASSGEANRALVQQASYLQPLQDTAAETQPGSQDPKNPDAANESQDKPEKQLSEQQLTIESLSKQINENKSLINSDESLDEATRNSRLEILMNASRSLQTAVQHQVELSKYNNDIDGLDPNRIKQELSGTENPELPVVTDQTVSEVLAQDLQKKREELETAKAKLKEAQSANDQHATRITDISSDKSKAKQRLADVEQNIGKVESQSADEETQLSRILLTAQKLAATRELAKLDAEARYLELAGKVLPLERDLIKRKITRLETEVASWTTAVSSLKKREIKKQADQARLAAVNAHPALQSLASKNQELAEQRARIIEKIQQCISELTSVKSKIEELDDKYDSLNDKIQATGLTDANGTLLVEHRRNLITPFESVRRIKDIQQKIQDLSLQVVQLNEERELLADPKTYVSELLTAKGSPLSSNLVAMGVEFAENQRQYLDDLIADSNRYRGLLSNVMVERENLTQSIDRSRQFVDQNALWLRSSDPIRGADVVAARTGAASFFSWDNWSALITSLQRRVSTRPHEPALGFCGLLVLFVFTRKLKPNPTDSDR